MPIKKISWLSERIPLYRKEIGTLDDAAICQLAVAVVGGMLRIVLPRWSVQSL